MLARPDDLADELEAIADAIARLRPGWGDLRPYYEQRSEISARLKILARRLPERSNVRIAPPRAVIVTERTVEVIRIVRVPGRLLLRRRNRYPRPPMGQALLPL